MNKLLLLAALIATNVLAQAQTPPTQTQPDVRTESSRCRPEILILGTYHMANPGHDIYNMKVDDVLSPDRQLQMAQLIEVLKKFHPTKIAIEASVGSKKVEQQYADYLAGKYTLTRNEIDQVGYR